MRTSTLLFALLAASASAGDTLSFEGPEDATKAEIDQCAAALTKRLAAYGFKGMTVGAVEKDGKRTVTVVSPAAIDDATRGKIELMALYAGQNPAVRFRRDLTAEEKAQGFDIPKTKDLKGAKTPKSCRWAECLGENFKSAIGTPGGWECVMLKDAPWISWSDVTVAEKGDSTWTFKLSAAATKVAGNEATGGVAGRRAEFVWSRISFDNFTWVSDTKIELTNKDKASLKEGTFTLPAAMAPFVEATLRYPMPKGLKPVPAEKK